VPKLKLNFFFAHYLQWGVLFLGRIFVFGRSLFSAGCYVLGTNFLFIFFGRSLFSAGCRFGVQIFLGPIGQEAEAKTVIISVLAVTAGQFLVLKPFSS
jgi:hypothetical protein